MEFQFNVNAATALKQEGGVDTGIHKAKITMGVVSKSKAGNNMLDVYFETMTGSKFAIYGLCIDEKWASGAENYDFPKWNELALSAGMASGATYDLEIEVTRDGKKVKEQAKAFTDLANKVVNVAVYSEFDVYNNKEKKSRKISRVFNANGLSVAEAQSGKTEGKTMAKCDNGLSDYYTKAHKEWKNGGTNTQSNDNTPDISSQDDGEDLI